MMTHNHRTAKIDASNENNNDKKKKKNSKNRNNKNNSSNDLRVRVVIRVILVFFQQEDDSSSGTRTAPTEETGIDSFQLTVYAVCKTGSTLERESAHGLHGGPKDWVAVKEFKFSDHNRDI